MTELTVDILVNHSLEELNQGLSDKLKSDIIFLKAAMQQPVDDDLRPIVEKLSADSSYDKLTVLLETNGGFIEVVERIVGIFRKHYTTIEFIVPNYAYSAGTVLVMSGDEIYMDYHSILGPIDPQFEAEKNGDYVPGMGYLAKYEELTDKINTAADTNSVKAELAYLVQKFDPAKLYHIEQAVEHSKSLLRDWLPKYKFKDWNNTETTGTPVTTTMKQKRADEIANILGATDRWHSHGRGITMNELDSEEIKLKVNDFGLDAGLSESIRNYYSLMTDYLIKMGMQGVIHTKGSGLRRAR